MDLKTIKELLSEFNNSTLTELKIENQDTGIYFSKLSDKPAVISQPTKKNQEKKVIDNTPIKEITAPMVGTVYLKQPNEKNNLKKIGDKVKIGETVAFIEAMKMMTDIKSSYNGIISEINVENEENVEYGQDIFTVTPID